MLNSGTILYLSRRIPVCECANSHLIYLHAVNSPHPPIYIHIYVYVYACIYVYIYSSVHICYYWQRFMGFCLNLMQRGVHCREAGSSSYNRESSGKNGLSGREGRGSGANTNQGWSSSSSSSSWPSRSSSSSSSSSSALFSTNSSSSVGRKKGRTSYVCDQCGNVHSQMFGKCNSCGAWGSLKVR